MVDPFSFTNYHRTREELEETLLFSILVAGKRADQAAKKTAELLLVVPGMEDAVAFGSPLDKIVWWSKRETHMYRRLEEVGTGQYRRIVAALKKMAYLHEHGLDLKTVSISELQAIPGIGPKTARMFVLHTREGERHAVLDTHILAWLKEQGVGNVPRATPASKKAYDRLEKAFLRICDERGVSPADLDLATWKERAKSRNRASV